MGVRKPHEQREWHGDLAATLEVLLGHSKAGSHGCSMQSALLEEASCFAPLQSNRDRRKQCTPHKGRL